MKNNLKTILLTTLIATSTGCITKNLKMREFLDSDVAPIPSKAFPSKRSTYLNRIEIDKTYKWNVYNSSEKEKELIEENLKDKDPKFYFEYMKMYQNFLDRENQKQKERDLKSKTSLNL